MCSKDPKGTYCLNNKDVPCSAVAHALQAANLTCTNADNSRISIASGGNPCESGYVHRVRPGHADGCEMILDPFADTEPDCGDNCGLAYATSAVLFILVAALVVGILMRFRHQAQ